MYGLNDWLIFDWQFKCASNS